MFGYSCIVFVLVAGLRESCGDSEPNSHRPVVFARVDFSKEDGGVQVKSVDVPVDAVDWNNLETLETGDGSEFMKQVRKFRPKWDDDEEEDEDEEEEEEANKEEELATKHKSSPESDGTSSPKPPQTRPVIFARLDFTKDSADEAVQVESVEVPVDAVDWNNLETLETGGGSEFMKQVRKFRPKWDDDEEEEDEDEDEEEEEEANEEEEPASKHQSGPESEGTSSPKPPQTRTVIFARLDFTKDSADEAVQVESVEVPVDAVDWKNLETLETGGGHEFLTQVKKYRPNWDDEDEENDDEDEEEEEDAEEKLNEKQQLSCDGKKQASENVLQQCDDGEKPQN